MYRALVPSLAVVVVIALLLMLEGVGAAQNAPASTTGYGVAATITDVANPGNHTLASISPSGTCAQADVPLGSAAHFSILAGTTVTNTGSTLVHGNLGVSPGAAVTGFPPGKVDGKVDKANTAAANAQLDLTTAYNNAMGRTNCPVAVAGNIGGRTLGPGLYRSTSSLAISSGDLTLDAHGHSRAVFVFQITTKFTMTSGRAVILSGGAQAKNIFWAVGSSASLGSTAVLFGNILAHKSISLATGAVLHGKALARIGAVTLEGNTITKIASKSIAAIVSESMVSNSLVARPSR
jgi:hypothetical protein